MSNATQAARVYNRNRAEGDVACASPHQLISLMLAGAQRHVAEAARGLEQGNTAHKGESTSKAIALLEELRASLDHSSGGDVSARLESLYEYMVGRLIRANLRDEPAGFTEVDRLIAEIAESWNSLPAQVANQAELKDSLEEYFHGRA